jgi:hypothetical protein
LRRTVGPAAALALATSLAPTGAAAGPARPAKAEVTTSTDEGGRGRVGLGVFAGNPAALSLKVFVARKHALQVDAGYAWLMSPEGAGRLGTVRGHLDWLWHPAIVASNATMDLLPYVGVGVGGGVFFTRTAALEEGENAVTRARPLAFLRLPVLGLSFHWQRVPMDTAIEASWTPAIAWTPGPRGEPAFADFGVAVRYYF